MINFINYNGILISKGVDFFISSRCKKGKKFQEGIIVLLPPLSTSFYYPLLQAFVEDKKGLKNQEIME